MDLKVLYTYLEGLTISIYDLTITSTETTYIIIIF